MDGRYAASTLIRAERRVKRRYLTDLRDEVSRLMRGGLTLEQIKGTLRLPKNPEIDAAMADALLPWIIEALHGELAARDGAAK